jgi:hypothetical protein
MLRYIKKGAQILPATPDKPLAAAHFVTFESVPAVFFLTCGGTKSFPDPRMNSLEAAFVFAKTSNLQVAAHPPFWRFLRIDLICPS